jgi:hypothetical protein
MIVTFTNGLKRRRRKARNVLYRYVNFLILVLLSSYIYIYIWHVNPHVVTNRNTEWHQQFFALSYFFIMNWQKGMEGHAVAQLVDALRYKPERRGFDS